MKPRTLIVWTVLSLAICLLLAGTASGQTTVRNPTTVILGVPYTQAEYDQITEFRLGYFAIPASTDGLSCNETATVPISPVQVTTFPKPAAMVAGEATGPIPSRPLGCYRVKAAAVANGLLSDWTGVSNPFSVPPAAPSGTVIR